MSIKYSRKSDKNSRGRPQPRYETVTILTPGARAWFDGRTNGPKSLRYHGIPSPYPGTGVLCVFPKNGQIGDDRCTHRCVSTWYILTALSSLDQQVAPGKTRIVVSRRACGDLIIGSRAVSVVLKINGGGRPTKSAKHVVLYLGS